MSFCFRREKRTLIVPNRLHATLNRTHFGAEHHYSMNPDDKNVINAFLSRLATRNIHASLDPDSPSPQTSDLPQTLLSSGTEKNSSQALCAEGNSTEAILIPDLDDQLLAPITSGTISDCTNMSGDRVQTPKHKGLFASKWGLETLDPSGWDPLSTSSSFSKLDTSKASRSNASSPFTSPRGTNQHISTQPIPEKKNKRRVADSFQLLKPSPNSIYADWSPEQDAKDRQEALDRGIQRMREARIKELEAELASLKSPPLGLPSTSQPLRDSSNSNQSLLEIPARTKTLPEAPPQISYSEEELLKIASTSHPESTSNKNLVRATALKDDLDPTVASLFRKLDLVTSGNQFTSPTSLSQPVNKPKSLAQPAGMSPSNLKVGTSAAGLSSSVAAKSPTTSQTQTEKHLNLERNEDSQPEANFGTWTKFAQQEQKKSAKTVSEADNSHLEEQLFFNAYPKPEKREGAPSERRKVHLTNLPEDSKPSSITSVVYGGPLELMHYVQGSTSAYVIFLHGKDALRFYDETANGIPCATNRLRNIWVELDEQPMPHSSMIKQSIEKGVTRSVKMVGISKETPLNEIAGLAMGSKMERQVVSIAAKKMSSGSFAAEIHFCSIKDAYAFKAYMNSNEDWEHCNIQSMADPCAENKKSG